MKTWIAAIALCSLAGLVSAAPDELEDSYNSLKEAVAKKDADSVRKLSGQASKLARAAEAAPAADDAAKQHVEFGKEVDTYSEYALAATAEQSGMEASKVVELVDQLEAQNPKSKYLDYGCLAADVTALSSLAGSAAAKSPDRALADANKLIAVGKKAKPEGAADADWERLKAAALGTGYYLAGAMYAQKQSWVDCDRELKDALPYIGKEPARMGPAEFYLGLCNYQFGRLTQDRSRLMAAQKYSEASAAIPGPMQQQAARNALAIKTELAGPTRH